MRGLPCRLWLWLSPASFVALGFVSCSRGATCPPARNLRAWRSAPGAPCAGPAAQAVLLRAVAPYHTGCTRGYKFSTTTEPAGALMLVQQPHLGACSQSLLSCKQSSLSLFLASRSHQGKRGASHGSCPQASGQSSPPCALAASSRRQFWVFFQPCACKRRWPRQLFGRWPVRQSVARRRRQPVARRWPCRQPVARWWPCRQPVARRWPCRQPFARQRSCRLRVALPRCCRRPCSIRWRRPQPVDRRRRSPQPVARQRRCRQLVPFSQQ